MTACVKCELDGARNPIIRSADRRGKILRSTSLYVKEYKVVRLIDILFSHYGLQIF